MFSHKISAAQVVIAIAVMFASSVRAAESTPVEKLGREGTVKVRIPQSSFSPAMVNAAVRVVADYGSFVIVEAPADAVPIAHDAQVVELDNFVLLNTGVIDTTHPVAKQLQQPRGAFAGKRLHLIQFAGPVHSDWYAAMERSGVQIVTYIPSNAYLVYGDSEQLARVQTMADALPQAQWNAEFLDAYKIQPSALPQNVIPNIPPGNSELYAIQLVADPAANPATLALVDQLKTAPVRNQQEVLNYRNIIVELSPEKVLDLAKQQDVISIQRYVIPKLNDERQDQIIAGNLTGGSPSGPGYLAWLGTQGFTQAQFNISSFSVDVTDSGLDNATTSPNHFGLYVDGIRPGTSRVTYNRLVGTPGMGSTLEGCDGHGNINAHIVAGFSNGSGFPFTDATGFHFGLGVCPFVRVGSSVIFDFDFTFPNFAEIQSRAYNSGARVSTNSWGANVTGEYNTDSQAYDSLVRDAQPTGSPFPVAGNQEMVLVFANGNAGSGPQTVGSPATAKNVISVGAAENVQPMGGADVCGWTDGFANSANEIAVFSSRGPCLDGRKKPDIVAPGTHVSGGVAQAMNPSATGTANACFNALRVCGGVGSNFFPSGQEFYTTSTGTSHSCPAVAGGCALIRQFFVNQGRPIPSPAMTKAILMNSARYLTGSGAGGSFWSNSQGMGEMNLGEAFKRGTTTPTLFQDQDTVNNLFTATGQTRVFVGNIADIASPFRVTLAWTDAVGNTFGNAYNNDLDLTVEIGANIYKGNVFTGAFSGTGGTVDAKNNVESVYVFSPTANTFTITVTAANINSNGVPNVGGGTDQDFALVMGNASNCSSVAISINQTSLPAGATATPYNQTLTATGGNPPFTWSLQSGAFPGGLSLSTGGVLSGSPTAEGTFNFAIMATDSFGCTGTQNFALQINCSIPGAPAITQQPVNQSPCAGGDATFSVTADSPSPMTFQWRKNGEAISGATNSTLTINSADEGDVAEYDVVLKNVCTTVTSTAASLNVVHARIVGHPDAIVSRTCDALTFSTVVDAPPPLSYQWRRDGEPLTDDDRFKGTQTEKLSISPLAQSDIGSYDVVVTTNCGELISDAAVLNVQGTMQLKDCPQALDSSALGLANIPCAECGAGASLMLTFSIAGWGLWRRRSRR